MIKKFHSKLDQKAKNFNLILSDLENLPLRGCKFSVLFSFTSLQNLPDVIEGLKEIFRVVKDGADVNFSILRKSGNCGFSGSGGTWDGTCAPPTPPNEGEDMNITLITQINQTTGIYGGLANITLTYDDLFNSQIILAYIKTWVEVLDKYNYVRWNASIPFVKPGYLCTGGGIGLSNFTLNNTEDVDILNISFSFDDLTCNTTDTCGNAYINSSGLKAMIGKGYRSNEVREALKKHTAMHLSTLGGAGALLSGHIVASEVIAYEDLGTEAIRKLQVVDFPAIIAYDCYGNSVYKTERAIT